MTEPDTSTPLLTPTAYELLLVEAQQVVELDVTFPEWVFKRQGGSIRFTDQIHHGWFTLRDFAELHGDDHISLVVLDPTDHEAITGPDVRMAFTLPTSSSRDDYYRAMKFSPDANVFSNIQTLGARIAAFGPSKRWAYLSEQFDHTDDPDAGLPEWHSWNFKDDE